MLEKFWESKNGFSKHNLYPCQVNRSIRFAESAATRPAVLAQSTGAGALVYREQPVAS